MIAKILKQLNRQTLVGWAVGWVGAVAMNAILRDNWDWKFWTALNVVLAIRIGTDLIYAWHDAKQPDDSGKTVL